MTRPHGAFRVRDVISELKSSPLEAAHVALGAKLVPFAGWNMPVQYTSIIDEHTAVRTACGTFDISHMGQFIVRGTGSEMWLNGLLTNNVSKLGISQGQYTLMLNENGGVIDDLIAYRTGEHEFFLVVNASMIYEDYVWMSSRLPDGVTLENESEQWAGMAIQGPNSASVFAKVCPDEVLPPRNGILKTAAGSVVCRTGYTGEDGFEFFSPASEAISYWDKFLAAGAKACALGARDSLRLEMGYPLNGNDLFSLYLPHRSDAGANLLPVQQHRTSATLRKATTKPRTMQMKLIVQDVQERCIEARGHAMHETVHLDLQLARHTHPPVIKDRESSRAGRVAHSRPRLGHYDGVRPDAIVNGA